jgi:hypothetical protein
MANNAHGSKSTLRWPLRLLNGTAKPLRRRVRLDEETLSSAAIKQTGLTDFGDPHYRQGLTSLIESAENDASLHFIGRLVMNALIRTFLVNRLLLAETLKRRPEIFHTPLLPPLVILGLPRSGTTFLHGMLALDPANRAPLAWQTMRPIANGEPDRRRQTYQWENRTQNLLIPKLDHMHFSRTDTPEECVILFGTTFVSAIFSTCAPVYGYHDWLKSQDRLVAYREYYALLQIIQGPDPARRFVLKSPVHTGAIDTLLNVIPDAMIIQTHRHPVPVCNSTNSLIYQMHNLVTSQHDIPRMVKVNIDTLVRWTESSMAVRDSGTTRVHDVFYDLLVADPIGTVKHIYAQFELEWTGAYEERLQAYVNTHPQGQHGKHVYSGSDFGLRDEETAERFGAYIRRYRL